MKRTRTTAGQRAPCKRARRCSQTSVAMPYNASAAEVRVATAELSSVGQGNVTVSGLGSPAQPFVVTFMGSLSATSVTPTANVSGITTGSGSQPGSTTQTSWGGPGTDEQQVVGYPMMKPTAFNGG